MANLSLRPLAAALGTSARMLLHYFGSKEQLIAEVMAEVQQRFQDIFLRLVTGPRKADRNMVLTEFWRVLSADSNRQLVRLLFEVQVLSLQNPKRYRRYLADVSSSWRGLIKRALPPEGKDAATATLYNAVVDGLLLELLSTGDLRRTSRALAHFTGKKARGTGKR